jgi:hypothetical protein
MHPNEDIIASVTLTKKLPNRRSLTAVAKLVRYGNNALPHFSVTGEERNLRRRGDNQIEVCGQLHPENLTHFPELAPLIKLHLADQNGVPMHAISNGVYWLQLDATDGAPDIAAFARLWRVTEAVAVEIYNAAVSSPDPTAYVTTQAHRLVSSWAQEAAEGLALIHTLAAEQDFLS